MGNPVTFNEVLTGITVILTSGYDTSADRIVKLREAVEAWRSRMQDENGQIPSEDYR